VAQVLVEREVITGGAAPKMIPRAKLARTERREKSA
jgi:hypothetical protein